MYLKNVVKHFKVVTKHKWVVFKLCCKIGEPWRGFLHDLSKYSLTEFLEGVKYFNGKYSPIVDCKKQNGYSKAWLHHKGRNKHHWEYWIDLQAPEKTPIIPYKYVAEMICDRLAAGIVYKGKDWTKEEPLKYFLEEKNKLMVNEQILKMLEDIFTQISINGINEVLKKENVKEIYKKYCIDYKKQTVGS